MKLVAYKASIGDVHGVTKHVYTFAVDDTEGFEVKEYIDEEAAVLRRFLRAGISDWRPQDENPTGVDERIEMFWQKNPFRHNLHLLQEMDIFINLYEN